MLFVSSTHCLGVLLLLLFVVCCGVRRLSGISSAEGLGSVVGQLVEASRWGMAGFDVL